MLEETENKKRNSIGMFDLCKGTLILFVIFAHSVTMFFHYWEVEPFEDIRYPFVVLFKIAFYGIVSSFFIISGYGFRQKKVFSSLKGILRGIWTKYFIVAFCVVVLSGIKSFLNGTSVQEHVLHAGIPFLLGLCPGETKLFGIHVGSIGPMWFLVALVLSWQILNLIFKFSKDEKTRVVILLLLSALVTQLQFNSIILYCCVQACSCSVYLYIGYTIKKDKMLTSSSIKWWNKCILFIAAIAIIMFGNAEVSQNVWNLDFLDFMATCIMGVLFVMIGVYCNRFQNIFVNTLCKLGHYSLEILCIHSVEYLVFPWRRIQNLFPEQNIVGIVVVTLIRISLILTVLLLLILLRKLKHRTLNLRKTETM